MNDESLFEACVPVLLRYLGGLERIVRAVDALPAPQCHALLKARLAADMLPFAAQVDTAVQLALRTACPLAGLAVPAFVPAPATEAGLRAKIAEATEALQRLSPEAFAGARTRRITERAGDVVIELPAAQFLHEFALPNFFFHVAMAYAIARAHGAVLGKAAFDGFHVYPMPA